MKLTETNQSVGYEHGVIAAFPGDFFGYFGWPTVARMDDGTLMAAASGLRNDHVCPFGRNVISTSADEGRTWTSPRVINDSPLDDRDSGVVCAGGERVLVSWFSIDKRSYEQRADPAVRGHWRQGLAWVDDKTAARWAGSWVSLSEDAGQTWGAAIRVPLTAPHGPIRLRSGELMYFGKQFITGMSGYRDGTGAIAAARSTDAGRSWQQLGKVPLVEGTREANYHEPHVCELPDGKLLGLIRFEFNEATRVQNRDLVNFSMMQTESTNGGRTWSPAEPMCFHGAPPHLMVHSSSVVVGVYGYRQDPWGQRIMLSWDRGASWDYGHILRDDGPDRDLGYPSSVELNDASILTVYYQKPAAPQDKCGLLWSRWRLPV